MFAIRFSKSSILPALVLSFLFRLNTGFAGNLNECLEPVWKVPRGHYIKQICRGYETPDDGCPSTMEYNPESELLTINYVKGYYHFAFNIDKPCSYVQDGLQLRVAKKRGTGKNGKPVDVLWFQADSRGVAKKTALKDLKEDDEPAILELATRGRVTETCNLHYYSPAGILAGLCKSDSDTGDIPFDLGEIALSYLDVMSRQFLDREKAFMTFQREGKRKLQSEIAQQQEQQKQEVWLYQLRYQFNFLPYVQAYRQLKKLTDEFSQEGFAVDLSETVIQGYALHNIDGTLRFQVCRNNFGICEVEKPHAEMIRHYCLYKGLNAVSIHGAVFCHDPRYHSANIKIAGCPVIRIAVDSSTGLLVAECGRKIRTSTFRFMENALSCLDNHKYDAEFYTAIEGWPYLACNLGKAEGVLIPPVQPGETASAEAPTETTANPTGGAEASSANATEKEKNRHGEL